MANGKANLRPNGQITSAMAMVVNCVVIFVVGCLLQDGAVHANRYLLGNRPIDIEFRIVLIAAVVMGVLIGSVKQVGCSCTDFCLTLVRQQRNSKNGTDGEIVRSDV